MKRLLYVICFFYSTTIFPVEQSFSLLTWNTLGLFAPDVQAHGFKKGDVSRLKRTSSVIKKYLPDIVCLQETGDTAISYFQGNKKSEYGSGLAGSYQLAAYAPKKTGKPVANSGSSIFLKNKGALQLIEAGGIQHDYTVCAWAVVEDKVTQQKLLVMSAHISRMNEREEKEKGEQEWSAVIQKLQPVLTKYADSSLIFAGDFNVFFEEVADEQDGTVKYLEDLLHRRLSMYHHNSWTASRALGEIDKKAWVYIPYKNPDGSMMGYEFSSIDHVVFSDNNKLAIMPEKSWAVTPHQSYVSSMVQTAQEKMQLSQTPISQLLPSDHAPVYVRFVSKSYEPHEELLGLSRFLHHLERAVSL